MKDFFKKLSIFTKNTHKSNFKIHRIYCVGLFVNSLYGLQTGNSRAFIILIESLLIFAIVALSSILLKD